jgi:hypothetical protein
MPDPSELMLNDSVYDDLLREAEIDKRVGDHEAIVAKVVKDKWQSGDPRTKVDFVLLTAKNAKADWTFSPPPPPEVVKAEKDTWEPGKLKAIAQSIAQLRQLVKEYGVTIDENGYPNIKEGDRFKVKTVKTRRDDQGKGGFIRIAAFLSKDRAVGEQAASAPASGEAPAF